MGLVWQRKICQLTIEKENKKPQPLDNITNLTTLNIPCLGKQNSSSEVFVYFKVQAKTRKKEPAERMFAKRVQLVNTIHWHETQTLVQIVF